MITGWPWTLLGSAAHSSIAVGAAWSNVNFSTETNPRHSPSLTKSKFGGQIVRASSECVSYARYIQIKSKTLRSNMNNKILQYSYPEQAKNKFTMNMVKQQKWENSRNIAKPSSNFHILNRVWSESKQSAALSTLLAHSTLIPISLWDG